MKMRPLNFKPETRNPIAQSPKPLVHQRKPLHRCNGMSVVHQDKQGQLNKMEQEYWEAKIKYDKICQRIETETQVW